MDHSGQTIGKYKLIQRLGQGGMAQVYKAIQPTIDRPVAIKIMHGHLAENEDFLVRFKREARGMGLLRHPNIVSILDFDNDGDLYFMVMDYIEGITLQKYLGGRAPLEPLVGDKTYPKRHRTASPLTPPTMPIDSYNRLQLPFSVNCPLVLKGPSIALSTYSGCQ